MMFRIGVDLGGTKIETIALDEVNRIVSRRRVPTPRDDYSALCASVCELVGAVEREHGGHATVGIGIPGTLEPATGLVKNANTTCLIGRALGRDLSAALRRAVRLANDANCFAISEAADGAAAGARTVFGVIIGTGTGGGLCVDGRCLEGANGIAGEWGHNPVPWRGRALSQRPCYCGRADCIETYLCGSGLLRTYHEREPSATAAHVQDIVARARGGDATARGVLDAYAEEFAQCLATVVNVFDPEVVVLGGGLSNLPDLAANVAARLPAHVFSPTVRTRVVRAVHGDSSGVRGAAWLWSVAEARAASSLAD